MTYQVPHFVNGQSVHSKSHKGQDLYNPALGDVIGQVAFADQAIVDQAANAAEKAYLGWSSLTPSKRGKLMMNYLQLLSKHRKRIADCVTREHGKTLQDAEASLTRGMDVVEYCTLIANHLKGEFAFNAGSGVDCYAIRQPLGVCVGITPFNFPVMIPLWMFSVAIACGNTFILKPSEKDPSVSLILAELALEAGIPEGVLNVVQGDKETVDALITHPKIAAVSFVGSSNVAEHVYQTGLTHGKRVQAFGGAKNHCIVMPDADLNQAADAIVGAAYGSAGERCMALSVVVSVGDDTTQQLIQNMLPKIQSLTIGPGTQQNVNMGPLITAEHKQRVVDYIDLGVQEGAKLLLDGRNTQVPEDGFFLGASLFDEVTPAMRIYQDEIFGPVLVIVRAKDFATALEMINDNPYGNGTALFTQSGSIAREFSEKVQVGMVGINVPIPVPVAYQSFGGWKRSMFGDIHMHGKEGVQFFTRVKTITSAWPKSDSGSGSEYTLPVHS